MTNPRGRHSARPIAVAAVLAICVAVLGGLSTDLGDWYVQLRKPAWQPPDWLFGPAWTLIYALTAAAGVLAWRDCTTPARRRTVLALFGLNGFLNVFWSLLFFRLQRPDWALVEVPFLWLSVLVLMFGLAPRSRLAPWLLLPYLLWVAFAGVLNYEVARLNGLLPTLRMPA